MDMSSEALRQGKLSISLLLLVLILGWGRQGYCNEGPLIIENLHAEENPRCAVTYFVTWTTNRPATTEVHYGYEGAVGSDLVRRSEALTLEHTVLLLALTPDEGYQFKVSSADESGEEAEAFGLFRTNRVPFGVLPSVKINTHDPAKAQDGWTLFDLKFIPWNRSEGVGLEGMMIVDMEGMVVWYGLGGFGDVEMLENGNLLVIGAEEVPLSEITLSGETVWEAGAIGDAHVHHDIDLIYRSEAWEDSFICLRDTYEERGGHSVEGVLIQEWRVAGGEVPVWEWSSFGTLDRYYGETHDGREPDWDWIAEKDGGDWLHANALFFDPDNRKMYLNTFFPSQVYKLDYPSGAVEWSFGPGGDFELLGGEWFRGAHDPEILPNGNILLFDNHSMNFIPKELMRYLSSLPVARGGLSRTSIGLVGPVLAGEGPSFPALGRSVSPPAPHALEWVRKIFYGVGGNWSRAVEYRIDEEARTAEQVWEYRGDRDFKFYSAGWGDADRLPNGNTLITDGAMDGVTPGALLIEVTPEGEKAWELELPAGWGVYKSQRIAAF